MSSQEDYSSPEYMPEIGTHETPYALGVSVHKGNDSIDVLRFINDGDPNEFVNNLVNMVRCLTSKLLDKNKKTYQVNVCYRDYKIRKETKGCCKGIGTIDEIEKYIRTFAMINLPQRQTQEVLH